MQLQLDFYNTNHEIKERAEASQKQAEDQQFIILTFFRCHTDNFSPCDLVEFFPMWPLTSIRRAITNLTAEGLLVKTHEMKIGMYGKQVHTWRLAN